MPQNLDARRIALLVAGGVGSAYIASKVLRYAASSLMPDKFPGEPNTAFLATPRSYVVLTTDASSKHITADDLEHVRAYDYIVVGGGTAGCVLASRLTEDPNVSVLVIESGHSDLRQFFSRLPAGYTNLFKTTADHDLATVAEKGCADRELQWPRGRMLGGCSSINAQIYNKGSPDDYDEWAKQGMDGWSYDELEPYMRKAETFTPNFKQVQLGEEELSTHGKEGPWQTGYTHLSAVSSTFLKASEEAGFPVAKDINTSQGTNGAVRFQTFIDQKGQRSSTATAYLTKDVMSRPNLRIATGQNVTRIVFDTSSDTPRAVGIEMASSSIAPSYLARARREVIMSAGSIHTPHILKLSGVGPSTELSSHNITPIKDLSHLGANLADHLIAKVNLRIQPGLSAENLRDSMRALPSIIEWLRYGTGPGTTNTAESALFYRSADHPTAPESLKNNDLTSGPRASDVEILSCAAYYHGHGIAPLQKGLDYNSLGAILLRPESRGSVELVSADPFAKPRIRANYLSTPHDRNLMVHALRVCQDIVNTKAYQRDAFVQWETPTKPVESMSDQEVLQFIRETSETIYHPMCTARMGQSEEDSVVDKRLSVHGVKGLRIVDASVFATPLACHPCAPVVMVAEKAADLIKEDWRVVDEGYEVKH